MAGSLGTFKPTAILLGEICLLRQRFIPRFCGKMKDWPCFVVVAPGIDEAFPSESPSTSGFVDLSRLHK